MTEHQALSFLHDYWERRSAFYDMPDVYGRRIIQVYLQKLRPQSLIEIGCGPGELFSLYTKIPYVVAVDWSDGMLERAKKRIERHEYKNIRLEKLNVVESYLPEKFHVALTRTCLMHIPPEAIKQACGNMTKMSDDIVIMEYYNANNVEPLAPHNWMHPYLTIFTELNYHLIEAFDRSDGIAQVLFHFKNEGSN